MLLSLHIENIAIIDKSDIDFHDGFNVLTGETGAGKSIIIDSINLLLGNKSSKDRISTGKDYAFVSAVFTGFNKSQFDFLCQNDVVPDEDGNIILSRRITSEGRSVCKINGQNVTVAVLKNISTVLVDIFGQHDGSKLLDPLTHIDYLDAYCKNDRLICDYKELFEKVKSARQKIQKLTEIKENKEQLEITLKHQIDQLEKADVKVGEYEKLKQARSVAQNNELISVVLSNADVLLSGEQESLTSGVSSLVNELKKIENAIDGVSGLVEELYTAQAIIEHAATFVGRKINDIDADGLSVDFIEERLYILEKIISKYGSEQNAIDSLNDLKDKLAALNDNENELAIAVNEYDVAHSSLEQAAQQISLSRQNGAQSLCEEIAHQLKELDMPQVKFCVDIKRNTNSRGGTKYTAIGFDSVEFLISANAGQQPKPISKIASGGELSRIMLCLKSSLSDKERECDTFVYDEVDSGVSGATAQKIGIKLKKASIGKQVFCITHLAQIAAMADVHYKVEKHIEEGVTHSDIKQLSDDERIDEIARIMGGVHLTEQLYKSAKELIDNSLK